jgi:hypothetical protein
MVLFETRYRRSKWKEVAAINHDIIGAEKKNSQKGMPGALDLRSTKFHSSASG